MKNKFIAIFVASILLVGPFSVSAQACTLVGASGKATSDGNAYLASTSDNAYLEGPRKPVCVTIPKNGYKFVHTPCIKQLQDGSFVNEGSDRGMNTTGFSWTRSWVVPDETEAAEKMNAVDWFIKMGSTVSSVDEAILFVQNNPKGIGCQGNYLFADAKGNMAVVEVGYQTVTVANRWSKNDKGIVARANRWETQEMKPLDISAQGNTIYYNTSEYRYSKATELLNSVGRLNADKMKRIVSFRNTAASVLPHEESISNHGTVGGTVSAEVYDIKNKTFWYTYGWPDGDVSKSDFAAYSYNKNTWGEWIPFILSELTEEGYYTDWEGNITPIGARYLARLTEENMRTAASVADNSARVLNPR